MVPNEGDAPWQEHLAMSLMGAEAERKQNSASLSLTFPNDLKSPPSSCHLTGSVPSGTASQGPTLGSETSKKNQHVTHSRSGPVSLCVWLCLSACTHLAPRCSEGGLPACSLICLPFSITVALLHTFPLMTTVSSVWEPRWECNQIMPP